MEISDEDLAEIIKTAVDRALAEQNPEHRAYVEAAIARDRARASMYHAIAANVIGWAVIGTVTFIGFAVISYVRSHI